MGRRVIVSLFALAFLGGVGAAVYGLVWYVPRPERAEPPTFEPSDGPLPEADRFAELARTDPVAMYEACLSKYAQEAKGMRAVLAKQERVRGDLHDPEEIRLTVWGDVPEHPGAESHVKVRMVWDKGAQTNLGSTVRGTLYVAGENNNEMRTLSASRLLGTVEVSIDPKSGMARGASRYCIKDCGVYGGMLRTYTTWKHRKELGQLRTEYLGKQVVEKAGNRVCHVVRRTCAFPEVDPFALDEKPDHRAVPGRDGATEITVMIDAERWLQVGSVLKRQGGDLLGEYYFRDVELTATEFPPDTFTMDGLKAAVGKK